MSFNWKIKSTDSQENSNDGPTTAGTGKQREKRESGHSKNAATATFTPREARKNLEDLVVPDAVRARIDSSLNKIKYHKALYEEWGLEEIDDTGKKVAINLYGLPGTGKSFCAEAIANYLGKSLIVVNYAEIESKYVGETPKNITAAFRRAKETDSVLFFDEADSILGKRLTNVTQSADHGVNVSRSVMLTQLDSFDGVVLFATNLASNYDSAFVRRILAHIEFELPDEECREKLWSYLIPSKLPRSVEITLDWLVQESSGLSGGEIKNAVISSASKAISRHGADKIVKKEDFRQELANIKKAKENIANPSSGREKRPVTITEQQITRDDLPEDTKATYDEKISKISLSKNG